MERLGLCYMHIIEGATQGPRGQGTFDYVALHKAFSGLYMANNGYDLRLAEQARARAEGRPDRIRPAVHHQSGPRRAVADRGSARALYATRRTGMAAAPRATWTTLPP